MGKKQYYPTSYYNSVKSATQEFYIIYIFGPGCALGSALFFLFELDRKQFFRMQQILKDTDNTSFQPLFFEQIYCSLLFKNAT